MEQRRSAARTGALGEGVRSRWSVRRAIVPIIVAVAAWGLILVPTAGRASVAGAAGLPGWTTTTTFASDVNLQAIACPTSAHCIVGGYTPEGGDPVTAVAYSTEDGGLTWSPLTLPAGSVAAPDAISSISCPTSLLCFAAGSQPVVSPGRTSSAAYIAVSTDGGLHWSNSLTGDSSTQSVVELLSISCGSEVDCVAVGDSGVVSTADGGATWTVQGFISSLNGGYLTGVSCASKRHCVTVGVGGSGGLVPEVLVTNDDGLNWTNTFSLPVGEYIDSVDCPSARACVSVGYPNRGGPVPVITSADGGGTWSQRTVPGGSLTGLTCVNARLCTAVGPAIVGTTGGSIVGTTDGGATWGSEATYSSPIPPLASVACVSVHVCLAAGGDTVVTTVPASIDSVQLTGTTASPQIVVKGSGFGSSPPAPSYPPGPCPTRGTGLLFGSSFSFYDGSGYSPDGPWTAGLGGPNGLGSCIGLVVSHWSSKKIVFTFGNDYTPGNYPYWGLRAGDPYSLTILGAVASGTAAFT